MALVGRSSHPASSSQKSLMFEEVAFLRSALPGIVIAIVIAIVWQTAF